MAGQIRLGDYIKLNTGEEGYVTDIGWRATTMSALANNMILVPNSKLGQAIVTNYHLPALQMSASPQRLDGQELSQSLARRGHQSPGRGHTRAAARSEVPGQQLGSRRPEDPGDRRAAFDHPRRIG